MLTAEYNDKQREMQWPTARLEIKKSLRRASPEPLCCVLDRLGPRVKKKKNGYPESSKVCYSIHLKKYIWCIRNHCIANFAELHTATRANKVW